MYIKLNVLSTKEFSPTSVLVFETNIFVICNFPQKRSIGSMVVACLFTVCEKQVFEEISRKVTLLFQEIYSLKDKYFQIKTTFNIVL